MSEAGLPGVGLKLGAEVLRGSDGVWYSATGADGRPLGVLRFEPARVEAAGGVARLVERTVAARGGLLPGTLPVLDLVQDAGRIWLITPVVPQAEAAKRTVALLLGSEPVSGPGDRPVKGHGVQEPVKKDLKDGLPSRLFRTSVGLVLVGAVAGAAVFAGIKLRDKKTPTPVQISSISVHNDAPVQPSGICDTSVDMVAEFTTNGGTGVVHYEWDIPAKNHTTQAVAGAETVSGKSPKVHLAWQLKLSGSGTVTATFRITNPGVLASGAETASAGDLKYQCP
ncbi:hypothetical protein [Catenulispora pinisilvae]|uniref:hypothetical protein n=1 Tax=Catenulispora pinisilvae TaxID=2705253 RepID=UPI0018928734|nr:hypothetical protein [Catenulispora pinisilvae]